MTYENLDARLINSLLADGRASLRSLGEELDVSVTTVSNHLNDLEEEGVIDGYTPRVDYDALGYDVTAIVQLKVQGNALPEVTDRLVEVECGFQSTDAAAENAVEVTREFLAAVGALEGETADQQELPVYRLTEPVPKAAAQAYEVYAANFSQVATGEVYALADDEQYVADEPFYPVLMSPYGYEDVFGYAAEQVGTLEA